MKSKKLFITLLPILLLLFIACYLIFLAPEDPSSPSEKELYSQSTTTPSQSAASGTQDDSSPVSTADSTKDHQTAFDLKSVPAFTGIPFAIINGNNPFFTENEISTKAFETYSKLDSLGRCGPAFANICLEIMPTEEREPINMVHPTAWHSSKYNIVDGESLYNRSHLIAFVLAGENANERNLITGTRFMNATGMNPFENMVADYVLETENHVLYRVTPIFEEDNLLATGVLMEAWSVEDHGDGICFCVFCYNVQPGIILNYSNGDNELAPESKDEPTYIINVKTNKFHKPDCPNIADISAKNKVEFFGERSALIDAGYNPSNCCNP